MYFQRCVPGPFYEESGFGSVQYLDEPSGQAQVGVLLPPDEETLHGWARYPVDAYVHGKGGFYGMFGGWSPCRSCIALWSKSQQCFYKAEVEDAKYDLGFFPLQPNLGDLMLGFRNMQRYQSMFVERLDACAADVSVTLPAEQGARLQAAVVDFKEHEARFLDVAERQGRIALALVEQLQSLQNHWPSRSLPPLHAEVLRLAVLQLPLKATEVEQLLQKGQYAAAQAAAAGLVNLI
jgi:hypothetical protein